MTAEPRNIQLFNRVTAIVLTRLYEAFPSPIDIDAKAIGTQACDGFTDDHDKIFEIITNTGAEVITFLSEEGFVRYRADMTDFDGSTLHQVRLTMRGLAVLGGIPTPIDEPQDRRTLGAQIRDAVQDGASQSVSALVSQFIGTAVGSGLRAFAGE